MALGKSLSAVSIEEAWSDLRYHLDWTQGKSTLVFIATESRAQVESLRERAALWAQRTGEPWTRAPSDDSVAPWLQRHLPQYGILWVELWDDAARLAALHVLNEVRIRFARPGGGCLVLCGPIRLLEEAAHEAADLWSIRSFAHVVRGVVPTRVEVAPERIEAPPPSDGGYRSVWRVTLFDEMRDERAVAVLRDVDRARALLSSDPVRARRFLDGSKNADSELARVLFGLVRAEIGGLLDDVVAVEVNLFSTLKHMTSFPSDFRVQVADAALSIGERFGAYDAAAATAEESLGIRRGLADSLGTPESRRDLSVSLENVGRVAEARHDWGAAERSYEESLGIRRGLADSLGTPESRRDLSVSLENVGRVAEVRSDWDSAARAYEEALEIVQELTETLKDPEVRCSLAKLWSDVGWVAYAQGDFYGAEWGLSGSLSVRLDLDEELKTLETRHNVAGAWDNIGWVAIDSGNYELAEEAYRKSLNIKRDLANVEKSPETLSELVAAIDSLVYNTSNPSEVAELLAEKNRIISDPDYGSVQ